MPKALQRQYMPKRAKRSHSAACRDANLDFIPTLRKPRPKPRLNSRVIEGILHAVQVLNWSYKDVAVKFNVSTRLIGKQVRFK